MISLIVLLAAVSAPPRIETFTLPKGQLPTEIARQGDGMAFISWTNWPAVEPNLGSIRKGRVQTHPLAKDHMPGLFAAGPDGSLWLTDARQSVLWHVGPDGKTAPVEVDQPTLGIAIDAQGQLWCSHAGRTEISAYSAEGTKTAEIDTGRGRFKAPAPRAQKAPPAGMAPTWAKQEQRANRVDVTPSWLLVDAERGLWFSDPTLRSIGLVSPDGRQDRYKLPLEWKAPPGPIVKANGLVWFVVQGRPMLGSVSPEGYFAKVDLAEPAQAIAVDGKDRIWFSTSSSLGYIDQDGAVQLIPLPKPARTIRSMAAGADGAMWFVDQTTKTIGRVAVP